MTELQNIDIVYLGRRELQAAGKTGEAWISLDKLNAGLVDRVKQEEDGVGFYGERVLRGLDYSLFASKKGASPLIGGIYSAKVATNEAGKIIQLGSKTFGGRRFDNEEFNSAIYTEDKAVGVRLAAERQLKAAKADNPLLGELRHLRELYRNTSPENRLAVEVLVLKALRNGV